MKRTYLFLFILLGLHLFLLFNLKFTAWPEMLSYPYLRNNGYLLYKDMIHPYPPVLTMALSIVFKFFGYKLIVLKIFTWLIILANDVFIFLIARKIVKKDFPALLSVFFYILTQPFLEGNQLWFDLAIVPSILLGTLFLLYKKYFLSGLLVGIAILTKQTTGLFLILFSVFTLIKERRLKPVINLISGPVILFLILLARLITEGAVSGFFNWTLIYPFAWWSKFPGYVEMILTRREVLVLGLLFLPLILLILKLRRGLFKETNLILLGLCILVSLILVYPRFSFFHFQITLAFISIILAYVFSRFYKSKISYLFYAFYFILILLTVIKPGFGDWRKETRFWGAEEERAVKIVVEKSGKNDPVYLLGPHSAVYVLSGRLPPKPWTDNFVWYLEIPGIQEGIIKRWEENMPKVVFTNNVVGENWYDLGTYRPQKITDWFKSEKIEVVIIK